MNRGVRAWVPLLLGAVAATVLVGAGLRLLAFNALGAGPAWSQQPVPDLGLLILPAIGLGAMFLLIRTAHQLWRRAGLATGIAVLLLVLGGWGLVVHSAATAASGCPDRVAPSTRLTRFALAPLDLPMFCQRLYYQPALPACPCRPTVPVVFLAGDQHRRWVLDPGAGLIIDVSQDDVVGQELLITASSAGR
ncbi:hypothetical protein [Amycolatopsis sp. RTGN1]|uniref:hypothetical protein n=1 Tax=Amycolatopsis ponsaeliensis TaxID=2992142 RepID=UPI0025502BCA|nr:hypothetical protein [Amycolatopsis sp. RTGN1]